MLPQMMPLPWVLVLFFLTISIISINIYVSFFNLYWSQLKKKVKKPMPGLYW